MIWQEELRNYFKERNFYQCIHILDSNKNSGCDDLDIRLNAMYLDMYMMVESNNSSDSFKKLSEELSINYKFICTNHGDNPKCLFYVAYIVSMGEWILNLRLEDIKNMYIKAWLTDSNNLLYKYGYSQFVLNNSNQAKDVFIKIFHSKFYMNELRKMSILGDSLIESMEYCEFDN